jgi:hypothetical protein
MLKDPMMNSSVNSSGIERIPESDLLGIRALRASGGLYNDDRSLLPPIFSTTVASYRRVLSPGLTENKTLQKTIGLQVALELLA